MRELNNNDKLLYFSCLKIDAYCYEHFLFNFEKAI